MGRLRDRFEHRDGKTSDRVKFSSLIDDASIFELNLLLTDLRLCLHLFGVKRFDPLVLVQKDVLKAARQLTFKASFAGMLELDFEAVAVEKPS